MSRRKRQEATKLAAHVTDHVTDKLAYILVHIRQHVTRLRVVSCAGVLSNVLFLSVRFTGGLSVRGEVQKPRPAFASASCSSRLSCTTGRSGPMSLRLFLVVCSHARVNCCFALAGAAEYGLERDICGGGGATGHHQASRHGQGGQPCRSRLCYCVVLFAPPGRYNLVKAVLVSEARSGAFFFCKRTGQQIGRKTGVARETGLRDRELCCVSSSEGSVRHTQ